MTLHASHTRLFTVIGLFVCSLFLFTVGLSTQEIIGFDSRFYLFAQEMLMHGPSWFPTTYDQPYPDYPATSTYVIYLAARLFGLTKWVAVLPTALMAAFTVVITYLIGELRTQRLGLYAAFFTILTFAFFKAARGISLDLYPTFIAACCFYLVYSADEKNQPKRAWWIYPLFLFGFIFRGPIGLVMPTGVVCVYYLLEGRFKAFFMSGMIAFILLMLCALQLLDAAYHVGGSVFMQSVMQMEVVGRMGSGALPFYFYFQDSLGSYALSYPIALLTLLGAGYYGLIKNQRIAEGRLLLKLAGWMFVILIGMSVPGDKKVRYVLPMVPALALLSAYPFAVISNEKYFRWMRAFFLNVFLYFPVIFFLLVEIIFYQENKDHLTVGIHYLPLIAILLFLQLSTLWFAYCYIHRLAMRDTAILFFAALSFAVAEIMVLEPIELYFDKAHDFVVAVEKQRIESHAQLVFYKENPDSMPIKYLINMPQYEKPVFIVNESQLMQWKPPAYFLTSAEYFMVLPKKLMNKWHIVASERIGHVQVVVFTKNG